MGGLVLFRTAEVAVNKGVTVGLTDCEDMSIVRNLTASVPVQGKSKLPSTEHGCERDALAMALKLAQECASASVGWARDSLKKSGRACRVKYLPRNEETREEEQMRW